MPTRRRKTKERGASTSKSKKNSQMGTPVRVITYNVLSSHLRDPQRFTKCTEKALDPNGSYKKLIKRLEKEIAANDASSSPIFCLQEVSRLWAGRLTAWFSSRGYSFVPSLYGREFNGYMGCAIAVPSGSFEITDCKIDRLSETQDFWPVDPAKELAWKNRFKKKDKELVKAEKEGWWKRFCRFFASSPEEEEQQAKEKTAETDVPKPHEEDIPEYFTKARYRHNTVIAVQVSPASGTGGKFWVGNYHMPCAFWSPPLMSIHAAILGQYMEALSKTAEYHLFLLVILTFLQKKHNMS